MKPAFAYLTLALLWACLYLPSLGSREIRGEEWRRTLPARTMLNTGEWIVPYSGGLPYVRKPPLINWVSAASFKLTGVQNEWTARLPSVLLMLGAAFGIYAFAKRVMGGDAAFVGTVFFLTSIGCLEKGRIAEIEVYYIAFTGVAFAAWLAGFMGKLNRWAAWLVAGVCLGLAFLAKGPVHLLFFYFIVLGACWKTNRWRELWSGPHLVGVAVWLGMFFVWAVPFMREYGRLIETQPWLVEDYGQGAADPALQEPPKSAFESWRHELSSRVTGEEKSSTKDWLVRGPRALVMFLPWVLFLPLLWKKGALKSAFGEDETAQAYKGMWVGVAAGFALMVLLPSSSPRYIAPLLGPVAMLLGWAVTRWNASALRLNETWRWIARGCIALSLLVFAAGMFITFVPPGPQLPPVWQLGLLVLSALGGLAGIILLNDSDASRAVVRSCYFTLCACAFLMVIYSSVDPWLGNKRDDVRPTARAIRDAVTPKDGPIYVFHLGQVPYPFYLPEDTIESNEFEQLPDRGVRWMLTTKKVDQDFRVWFERRYGAATRVGEWTGAWGDSEQEEARRMVLLRFAGK